MSVPMVYSLTERYFGQCLLVLSSEAHIFTGVPLATEPGISLIILPLMRILKRNLTHSTDTFLFTSHTTNVLLFKFRCNIFIGVRIIKEIPGFGSEWDTLYMVSSKSLSTSLSLVYSHFLLGPKTLLSILFKHNCVPHLTFRHHASSI